MDQGRVKATPMLFPGLGSPLKGEIRRVEADAERGTRAGKEGAAYER